MSAITLRQALGVLAKSSSFSVATVTQRQKDEYDHLKEQLFVKQEIELDLQRYLDVATSIRRTSRLCSSFLLCLKFPWRISIPKMTTLHRYFWAG